MIGTPALTGELDVLYVNSLVESIRECANKNIILMPVFIANESMLPIARNDLIFYAYESKVDDLVFIDADQNWTPQQLLRLLSHNVDMVAGTCRKKINNEQYVGRLFDNEKNIQVNEDGLAKMKGVGTGFLRLSQNCIRQLYESSELYDVNKRSVFEYKVIDGNFTGEDLVMCYKWKELGGNIFLDTEITIGHVGKINFTGNFKEWANKNNLLQIQSNA